MFNSVLKILANAKSHEINDIGMFISLTIYKFTDNIPEWGGGRQKYSKVEQVSVLYPRKEEEPESTETQSSSDRTLVLREHQIMDPTESSSYVNGMYFLSPQDPPLVSAMDPLSLPKQYAFCLCSCL